MPTSTLQGGFYSAGRLALCGLVLMFSVQLQAAVPTSQGSCNAVVNPGLPCIVDIKNDSLANPVPPNPLTPSDYNNDTPVAMRAAIYDATGVDPGALTQEAKAEASNSWMDGGLSVSNGGSSTGTWQYTYPSGGATLQYLSIKAATFFEVFELSSLITSGTNGAGTIIGDWNTVALGNKGLSHLSVFSGTGSTQKMPEPLTSALLLLGLVGVGLFRGTHINKHTV